MVVSTKYFDIEIDILVVYSIFRHNQVSDCWVYIALYLYYIPISSLVLLDIYIYTRIYQLLIAWLHITDGYTILIPYLSVSVVYPLYIPIIEIILLLVNIHRHVPWSRDGL